uniref:Uncharacterized protein n=1 Tax=Rhizophora mucronata TaxID=61149 RepID=A0A2P2PII1_RHIMU
MTCRCFSSVKPSTHPIGKNDSAP